MKINPTLKLYWYGLFLFVSLLSLTILTSGTGSKLKSFMLESALRKEWGNVYFIGTETGDEISRLISVLQHTSSALSLTKDPVQKQQFLNAVLQKEHSIRAVHVLNKNGDVLIKRANTDSKVSNYSPCHNCPVVSVPLTGNIFTESVLSIDNKLYSQIAIPVGDQNNIRGILLTITDPNILWRNIQSAFNRKESISYLADSSGHLLVSLPGVKFSVNSSLADLKPLKAVISGHKWSGKETYIGLNGDEVFGVVTPVNSMRWWIVSEIPVQTITDPITSTIYHIRVFVFIIFFLSVSISMIYVKRRQKRNTVFSAGLYPIHKEDSSDYIDLPHISERNDMPVMALPLNAEHKPDRNEIALLEIVEDTMALVVKHHSTVEELSRYSQYPEKPLKLRVETVKRLPQLVRKVDKPDVSTGNTHMDKKGGNDYSKMAGYKLITKSVTFDLRQAVEDAVDLLLLKAREKGIELTIQWLSDVPAYVDGDHVHFGQIIGSLISNAIKSTFKGQILIEVKCESRSSNMVQLIVSVKDSGIVIPKEDTSETYQFGGSNLSLFECKQLVELMGGEISVYSEAGKGLNFRFTLNLPVVKEKYEFLSNDDFKKIIHKGNSDVQSGNLQDIKELIDKQEALKRIGGDKELFGALLQLFIIKAPQLVNELGEAISAKDLDLVKQVVYSLKVAAENIGFITVQQESIHGESAAENKDWERLQLTYERIRSELDIYMKFKISV